MKREQRRLRLARRQALLADVSQRAAMRSLADALVEEARSDTLAQRSRDLVTAYGGRSQAQDGAGLAEAGRFSAALGSLAHDAEQARADASEQAQWQAQALGEAQTRAQRQAERLDDARAALRDAREKREHQASAAASTSSARGLAHNLQSEERVPGSGGERASDKRL
ncbi:MAG: hypothetical protein AAFY19_10550 [Pseudomonadota bacterium]